MHVLPCTPSEGQDFIFHYQALKTFKPRTMKIKTIIFVLSVILLSSGAIQAQFNQIGPNRLLTTDSVGIGEAPRNLFHVSGNVSPTGSLAYIRVLNSPGTGSALTLDMPQNASPNSLLLRGLYNGQTVASINRQGDARFTGTLNVGGRATIGAETQINGNLRLRASDENTSIFFTTQTGRSATIGLQDDNDQGFYVMTNGAYRMSVNQNGNVAIGTTLAPTGYRLSVDGRIICEELRVQLSAQWPDYVFRPNYQLTPLLELEKKIKALGHLPNIPSAQEMAEKGLAVGDMQSKIMEKVEELTLYIIELKKENEGLKKAIQSIKSQH
jgi:hypothetical protein